MSDIQIRCHSVTATGPVCPPATAPCAAYGGGNCGSTPTTQVLVPSTQKPRGMTGDTLPFTGGDIIGLSMLAIGLIAGGAALIRSGRRKAVVPAGAYDTGFVSDPYNPVEFLDEG